MAVVAQGSEHCSGTLVLMGSRWARLQCQGTILGARVQVQLKACPILFLLFCSNCDLSTAPRFRHTHTHAPSSPQHYFQSVLQGQEAEAFLRAAALPHRAHPGPGY